MENEINEDEVFEKKESKTPNFFKNKKKIIVIIAIIIVVILCSAVFATTIGSNIFSAGLFSNKTMGNTNGNIIDCGYSVEYKGYLYYVAPSDTMDSINLYKAKIGTTDSEKIYDGKYDIRALNVIANKIYFISISTEETSDEDKIDNKIYKMNLDGSNLEVINDNDFAYDEYSMYVIGKQIYYVGEDYNVYRMDLNGNNRELVVETGTGFLAINNKYIIYNKENSDGSDNVPYIKKLNNNDEKVLKNERIFSPILYGDEVYYVNQDEHLAKININNGKEEELINYPIIKYNISKNGTICFLNYKDEENEDYTVAIFRLDENGDAQLVKELYNYTSFLNLVGDFVYYIDMDDEQAFVNLVNIYDSSETRLYNWKFDEIEKANSESNSQENVSDNTVSDESEDVTE